MADVAGTLRAALAELRCARVVLVVDGLDFLVATSAGDVAGAAVHDMLLGLREVGCAGATAGLR